MAELPVIDVDEAAAYDRLMRFLAVEGVTGREAAIAREVTAALREAGVPKSAIRHDAAHDRIPLPTECGNLIVTLPGTRFGPRLLFSTHLDTVPLAAGAKPVRKGSRVVAAGPTALGGDNRTGCAVLVTLAATLLRDKLPHPPLTLLFTVREESGLWGARFVDVADLGNPVMGFNFDGRSTTEITIGAVGAERWDVEILGKAAHAGVHPDRGISATAVASLAVATVVRNGWFGKVVKNRADAGIPLKPGRDSAENRRGTADVERVTGTSNVGVFGGRAGRSAGDATNVVTDYVHVQGESRSHEARFARAITAAYREAFAAAGTQVRDAAGRQAKVRFAARLDYHPFRLKESAPVVRHASRAVAELGAEPTVKVADGGLDANWLVRHKVPTVTLGAGQNAIHTVDEFVDLTEFAAGCRLAVALAALDAG
ncbi:MAG TPA: M20/M25/M40 family metallo-hydrolase [Gemmataceae bacterium]|jgi:tripeptide aminopeptidase